MTPSIIVIVTIAIMIIPSLAGPVTKAVAIGMTRAAGSSPLLQAAASLAAATSASAPALLAAFSTNHVPLGAAAATTLGSTGAAKAAAVATSVVTATTGSSAAIGLGTTGTKLALLSLTGGAQPTKAIDLTRFRLRLDGLHTYSVITTLLLNGALRLFTGTPKKWQDGQPIKNAVKLCFSVATILSVLAGSYTTIVFSLLGLYAKRALGRGLDDACWQFFQQSQPIREVAYDACLVSLVSFQAAFCLSVYLNNDSKHGLDWKLGLGAGVLAWACWWHWSTIYILAKTVLQLGPDM